jgi:hypothetical protein
MDMVGSHQADSGTNVRGGTGSEVRSRGRFVLLGCLAIALFFLITEHRAHFFGVLPYLLLLLCPAMHLWMHGRHEHSHGGPPEGR